MTISKITKLAEQGADFSKIPLKGLCLQHIDFRNAKNLTAENWLSAKDLRWCVLPTGMDFRNVSLKDREIHGIDFSRVTGLTVENWLSAYDVVGTTLPAGMDFSGVSLEDESIGYVDFSQVQGLTLNQVLQADYYDECILSAKISIGDIPINTLLEELKQCLHIRYDSGKEIDWNKTELMRPARFIKSKAEMGDQEAQRYLLMKALQT